MSNFNLRRLLAVAAVSSLSIVAGVAHADTHGDTLVVSSYDMLNGDGKTDTGTFNYWDGTYNGPNYGPAIISDSPLSGSTGVLTDGKSATDVWYKVSNEAGTGPDVGWHQKNPIITFHFAHKVNVQKIKLSVDNSLVGDVMAPASIVVNGVNYKNTNDPAVAGLQTIVLGGLNISGTTVTVQLIAQTEQQGAVMPEWLFLSEVQFIGTCKTCTQ